MMCCQRVSVLATKRARWPRSAPCASPHAPVADHCGAPIRLHVRYHCGRKHLPIVDLRRAAQQSVLPYLGIGGISWRRLLSLCSDVHQVGILKHLRSEDAD